MAVSVERLARIVLNSADPEGSARFFVDTFGFAAVETANPRGRALALGSTRLDLRPASGRRYPADVRGWSPLFQHFALLVSDFTRAMTRLEKAHGWTPISIGGPEHLPPSSGGVTAFKFRDSEGHPLELLALPDTPAAKLHAGAPFLRIDHSAISVADTQRSVAFYASLGLNVGARTWNAGPQQERLDAIAGAKVEVTALDLPSGAKPHVELLCYRGSYDRRVAPAQPDDIAATRLVFCVESAHALAAIADRHSDRLVARDVCGVLLRDPDGHFIQVEFREI